MAGCLVHNILPSQFCRQRVYPFSKQASVWLRSRETNKPATEPGMLHWLENEPRKTLCVLIICFTHLWQQWTAQTPATGRADSWLHPPAEQEWPFCYFSLYLQIWEQEGQPLPCGWALSSQPAPSHHCHTNPNHSPETPHLPLAGTAFLEQQQPSSEPVMLQHLCNIISGKSLLPYYSAIWLNIALFKLCYDWCYDTPFTLRISSILGAV